MPHFNRARRVYWAENLRQSALKRAHGDSPALREELGFPSLAKLFESEEVWEWKWNEIRLEVERGIVRSCDPSPGDRKWGGAGVVNFLRDRTDWSPRLWTHGVINQTVSTSGPIHRTCLYQDTESPDAKYNRPHRWRWEKSHEEKRGEEKRRDGKRKRNDRRQKMKLIEVKRNRKVKRKKRKREKREKQGRKTYRKEEKTRGNEDN